MVASQHFLNVSKWPLRGYIPHWNHTFRFLVIIGLVYISYGIFVPRVDVRMLRIDFKMHYHC